MRPIIVGALVVGLAVAAVPGGAAVDPFAKLDDRLARALDAGEPTVRLIALTHGAPQPAADAARALGAHVAWEYGVIDGFAATMPSAAVPALAARADVASVHLDRAVTVLMDVSAPAVGAPAAWESGARADGVTVAVIDTGIDHAHPALFGSVVSCVSLLGGLPLPECHDNYGHGTHVAGSVASRHDSYTGVAPGASLAVVRVLHAGGAGLTSDVIAGIDWVWAHHDDVTPPIRVATMSIGFIDPDCGDGTDPSALAADRLVAADVVFTVAAGNSGHDRCTIDGAAAARGATTVGAVDDQATPTQTDDVIADFSSGGPTADGRIKPDVAFPGVAIRSAYLAGLHTDMSGTSMATPHAAGVAALIRAEEPALTAEEVKARILSTAIRTDHTGTVPNSVYGHGLGNACLALGLAECG